MTRTPVRFVKHDFLAVPSGGSDEFATLVDGAGIALLRLDVTCGSSYYNALAHLYPLVSPDGVVIIDDWQLEDVRAQVLRYCSEAKIGGHTAPIVVYDADPADGIAKHHTAGGKFAVWRKAELVAELRQEQDRLEALTEQAPLERAGLADLAEQRRVIEAEAQTQREAVETE